MSFALKEKKCNRDRINLQLLFEDLKSTTSKREVSSPAAHFVRLTYSVDGTAYLLTHSLRYSTLLTVVKDAYTRTPHIAYLYRTRRGMLHAMMT